MKNLVDRPWPRGRGNAALLSWGLTAVLLACGCTDDVDVASYAVDVDESGAVDCGDLDHVLACVHHEIDDCDLDDVNHDGVVDQHDADDIHAGLEHHGHHCDAP